MTSFKTHDVEAETLPDFYRAIDNKKLWAKRFTEKKYDYSTRETTERTLAKVWNCSGEKLLPVSNNALVEAVGLAYNNHIPLSLSPDAIWSVIGHSFSMWINENAEAVRSQFVAHEGKKKIEVEVPGYEAHDPNWQRILGEFSEKIADHVGKKRNLFLNDFSTTTFDSQMGSEAILMYAMSKYFSYGMRTMCGFPSITLEGTPDDWHKIVGRVQYLAEFALGDDDHLRTWVNRLLPVVQEFALASEGKVNADFWRSFYREDGGSGGPYIDGHVTNFFPYTMGGKETLKINEWKTGMCGGGPTLDSFRASYSPVDVKWLINGGERGMQFHGGLVGVSYKENILRPEVGWCITETLATDETESE